MKELEDAFGGCSRTVRVVEHAHSRKFDCSNPPPVGITEGWMNILLPLSTKSKMKVKFDAVAFKYDRWDAVHRSVEKPRRSLLRRLGGKILEIGVGTGLNLPCYRRNADVTGCDISGKMLKRAVDRLTKMGEHRIKLLLMEAHQLLFLNGSFDAVVGIFLFCSVDDPIRVAREIKRVLRPGGQFVTLGYHTGRVERILGRAGLKVISTRECTSEEDPVGEIVAVKDPKLPSAKLVQAGVATRRERKNL